MTEEFASLRKPLDFKVWFQQTEKNQVEVPKKSKKKKNCYKVMKMTQWFWIKTSQTAKEIHVYTQNFFAIEF